MRLICLILLAVVHHFLSLKFILGVKHKNGILKKSENADKVWSG